MHRDLDPCSFGLDPERAAIVAEIFELHGRVHDLALAVAGPSQAPPDLTMQQLRVLGFVAKDPGLSGHELGERLGVSAPTASGLVDRLVEKGLLVRRDDPDDRRVRRLNVTESGQVLMRQMDSLMERAMMKVIQLLTVEELATMRLSAQVMLTAMKRAKRRTAEEGH